MNKLCDALVASPVVLFSLTSEQIKFMRSSSKPSYAKQLRIEMSFKCEDKFVEVTMSGSRGTGLIGE